MTTGATALPVAWTIDLVTPEVRAPDRSILASVDGVRKNPSDFLTREPLRHRHFRYRFSRVNIQPYFHTPETAGLRPRFVHTGSLGHNFGPSLQIVAKAARERVDEAPVLPRPALKRSPAASGRPQRRLLSLNWHGPGMSTWAGAGAARTPIPGAASPFQSAIRRKWTTRLAGIAA